MQNDIIDTPTHKTYFGIDLASLNWHRILDIFYRIMAFFVIIRGLIDFGEIIGLVGNLDFVSMRIAHQSYLVFNCCISFIAGIGLWMLNRWGSAIWLFMLILAVLVDVAALSPKSMLAMTGRPFYKSLFDIMLIIAYFFISTQMLLNDKKQVRI